jgi:hypothetical protein
VLTKSVFQGSLLRSKRRKAAVIKILETGYNTSFLNIAKRGVSVHAIITIAYNHRSI